MTQQDYDLIRETQRKIFIELPKRHDAELTVERLRMLKLKTKCDHVFPSGSTALEDGKCRICSKLAVVPMTAQSLRIKET